MHTHTHTRTQVGEVIAKSDYILVAAALTPSTVGMVGAAELARVSAPTMNSFFFLTAVLCIELHYIILIIHSHTIRHAGVPNIQSVSHAHVTRVE